MRTLYLHIGHGKTGSSWLQSCFTLSRDAMAKVGVAYPAGKFDKLAAEGKVTPGNGQLLIDAFDRPRAAQRLAASLTDTHCLFSSELLANQIADRLLTGAMQSFMDTAGFSHAKILLFIRDPLDHLASHYQQVVKRAGETRSLVAWARHYDTPVRIAAALQAIQHNDGADITVWNYSREKANLKTHAANWLGLEPGLVKEPERSVVNRSLTADELALQLIFNEHFGKCGPLVSDPLCEELPEIAPSVAALPRREADMLINRLTPAIRTVNSLISPDQAYRVDPPRRWSRNRKSDGTVTLSHQQLSAVARRLAEELARSREG